MELRIHEGQAPTLGATGPYFGFRVRVRVLIACDNRRRLLNY